MLKESKSYFEEQASEWVEDAYSSSREKLPIGEQRLKCVLDIINKLSTDSLNILDIGSGGGQITKALLARGHKVTAVDRSQQMLTLLENECLELPETLRKNLNTIHSCATSLEEKISKNQYDVIICIGMIYYLEDESIIYKVIQNHLNANGTAIITFRNKLFNLFQNSKLQPHTPNDLYEIYQQTHQIDQKINTSAFRNYLISLKEKIDDALRVLDREPNSTENTLLDNTNKEIDSKQILGRSHTPLEVSAHIKQFNLQTRNLYGIQPHFMLASNPNATINKCLQLLSSALWQLHDTPSCVLWCSHFLVELKRT